MIVCFIELIAATLVEKKSEDAKGVIKSRKSKKNRQYNYQNKKGQTLQSKINIRQQELHLNRRYTQVDRKELEVSDTRRVTDTVKRK